MVNAVNNRIIVKRLSFLMAAFILAAALAFASSALDFDVNDLNRHNDEARTAAMNREYDDTAGTSTQRVYDYLGYLTETELLQLESYIAQVRTETGRDFVVLISEDAESTGESASHVYADDFYDYNLFGKKADEYSGYLFFIDMANRLLTISTCGDMQSYINDEREEAVFDITYNYIQYEDYYNTCYYGIAEAAEFFRRGMPEGAFLYADESVSRVYDEANVFSEESRARLEAQLYGYRSGGGVDVVIVTGEDASADAAANELKAKAAYETLANDVNSRLLPAAMVIYADRAGSPLAVYISGGLSAYVTDKRAAEIVNAARMSADAGDYYRAASEAAAAAENYYSQGAPNTLSGTDAIIAAVAGIAAGAIYFGATKSRYQLKGSTYSYDVSANTELELRVRRDDYVNTTVTKVRKQTDSGNGGGGGRSGGSGTHTSSSGRSHGGGSRGF